MHGYIEVHQPTRAAMGPHKYVERLNCRRDSHEGITRENGLCVVSEKSRPALIAT